MRAVVVYESMYGNTHLVADAVADGLRSVDGVDAEVVVVAHASADALAGADVVVVGGPTHVHGLSRPSTRKAAAEDAQKPGRGLELEADAEGEGLREWFDAVGALPPLAAAFDTRLDAPVVITGRASKGIAKRLRRHGSELLDEPRSFLVTKENELEEHEVDEARSWGRRLGVAAGGGQADGGGPEEGGVTEEMEAAARQESEYPADETDEG
jgi:Flavodoxin domain